MAIGPEIDKADLWTYADSRTCAGLRAHWANPTGIGLYHVQHCGGVRTAHLQEKLQFYNVARSSTAEVRSLLYVIEDNYSRCAGKAVELREQVVQTGKLITGLIRSTERRRPGKVILQFLASLLSS